MNLSFLIFLLINQVSWIVSSDHSCVFQYNSSFIKEGEIYSPNYPNPYLNNLNCRYEFNGLENECIILEVVDFQLEPPQGPSNLNVNFMDLVETVTRENSIKTSESDLDVFKTKHPLEDKQCFYDFLDVFTINNFGVSNWYSRHCGNTMQKRLVSSTPNLILVFQTDRMLAYKGFRFRFTFSNLNVFPLITKPICGSSNITGVGGIISSPSYPNKYPDNIDCAWTITVEPHQTILVKFTDINFEESCKKSFVRIWDGYVGDIENPDFNVCEQLKYYHKEMKEYISKSNRIVISFEGAKTLDENNRIIMNNDKRNSPFLNKRMNKTKEVKLGGFSLIWTAVKIQSDCDGFQCKGGQYCIDTDNTLCHSTNEYCISQSLACDGIHHCDYGDESDEKSCSLVIITKNPIPFGIIFILISFILLSIICAVYKMKGHKDKDDLKETSKKLEYNEAKKPSGLIYLDTVGFKTELSNTDTINEKYPPNKYNNNKSFITFKSTKPDIENFKYQGSARRYSVPTLSNSFLSLETLPKLEVPIKKITTDFNRETYLTDKPRKKMNNSVSHTGNFITKKQSMPEKMSSKINEDDESYDDSKSMTQRRNSYTLAIFEND